MMFVQNGNRPAPDLPVLGRGGNEGAKAPVATPGSGAGRDAAVELPKVAVQPVAQQQPSPEQVKTAVEQLNKAMRQSSRNLEFSVDESTNRVVVRMTDATTGEVIRQIPSEETLAIARAIGDFQQGLLLSQKA